MILLDASAVRVRKSLSILVDIRVQTRLRVILTLELLSSTVLYTAIYSVM